jgi:hypothetical protein
MSLLPRATLHSDCEQFQPGLNVQYEYIVDVEQATYIQTLKGETEKVVLFF